MQSRPTRVRDVLTSEQVNEIADAPAGEVLDAARTMSLGKGSDAARMGVEGATPSAAPGAGASGQSQPKLSMASISRDGKVTFEAVKDPEKKQ